MPLSAQAKGRPGGHGWRAAACEPGRGLRRSQPPAPPASRAGRTPHLCLSRPAVCCHDSLSGWRPGESRERDVSLQPTRSASECLPFTSSRRRSQGFKDTPGGTEWQPAGQGTHPAMARPAAALGPARGPTPQGPTPHNGSLGAVTSRPPSCRQVSSEAEGWGPALVGPREPVRGLSHPGDPHPHQVRKMPRSLS